MTLDYANIVQKVFCNIALKIIKNLKSVLDPLTKQCVITVYPQLFDTSVKETAKITVTLQVSKDLDDIGKVECLLINKDSLSNIEIKTETDDNTVKIEFKPSTDVTEMKLSCSLDSIGLILKNL
uniref:Uncharacterized protein n=1 Tax=Panagrolaimus sp. ES5 TaxID=591445 RepID=A0AC34GQI5_9BILA